MLLTGQTEAKVPPAKSDALFAGWWVIAVLVAALIPSFILTWQSRDVPHFGQYHDETMYYVSGKSLVQGHGYRIESVPGSPLQTKYPPLHCAFLGLAWLINPAFPQNLTIAVWLMWLTLPVYTALSYVLFRRSMEFGSAAATFLTASLCLNAFILMFSMTLLSEQFFTCLLLASIVMIERSCRPGASVSWALFAGLAGGAALLTRGAGLPFLAAGCVPYLLRQDWKRAGFFLAGMFPLTAGWLGWSALNQSKATDLVTLYYTGYFKYQVYNVRPDILHLVLWKNFDAFLTSAGSFFLPNIIPFDLFKILCTSVGVLVLIGVARCFRRPGAQAYVAFAGLTFLLLVVWHMPPTERFLIPILPLLVAGLVRQLMHLSVSIRAGLRNVERSQRVAARVLAGAAILLLTVGVVLHAYIALALIPYSMQHARKQLRRDSAAYAWIRANTPASATFLADNDGVLYLHTGRQAIRLHTFTTYWYTDEDEPIRKAYRELDRYAHQYGIDHAYYTDTDFRRELSDDQQKIAQELIRKNLALKPLAEFEGGVVYRILSGSAR